MQIQRYSWHFHRIQSKTHSSSENLTAWSMVSTISPRSDDTIRRLLWFPTRIVLPFNSDNWFTSTNALIWLWPLKPLPEIRCNCTENDALRGLVSTTSKYRPALQLNAMNFLLLRSAWASVELEYPKCAAAWKNVKYKCCASFCKRIFSLRKKVCTSSLVFLARASKWFSRSSASTPV